MGESRLRVTVVNCSDQILASSRRVHGSQITFTSIVVSDSLESELECFVVINLNVISGASQFKFDIVITAHLRVVINAQLVGDSGQVPDLGCLQAKNDESVVALLVASLCDHVVCGSASRVDRDSLQVDTSCHAWVVVEDRNVLQSI